MRGGNIYASAVGKLKLDIDDAVATTTTSSSSVTTSDETKKQETEILPHIVSVELESGRKYASSQVLSVGQTVMGKVGRITHQQAAVEIVAADTIGSLREHHSGVIRKEDIRVGVSENVDIYESFRPGDIVSARIISLGDVRRLFLSTAENDLGVIRAVCSQSGKVMTPISWKEMECPETKIREYRKCAKPSD